MKIKNLFEDSDQEKIRWFVDNSTFGPDQFTIKNGLVSCEGFNFSLFCQEIKYPMGKVDHLGFMDGITSTKNWPTEANSIDAGGQSLTSIGTQAIRCHGALNIANNKIKSFKNIHKIVSCANFCGYNNPLEDSALGILLIPGLKIVQTYREDEIHKDQKKTRGNEAIIIIAKYVGKGKAGMIDCQSELIENDLEDFAKL